MMRRFVLGAFVVLVMLATAQVAVAADPPTLSGTVFDQTGKLSGGTARIDAAAASLKADHNLILKVAFVNALDGEDPAQFAERTAAANNLVAGRNVLFVVSINDRKDAVWSSGETSIDANELTSIRQGRVEPKLKAGDFVGAVEAVAVGFGVADAAASVPVAPTAPDAPAVSIDFTPLLWLLVALIVIFTLATVSVVTGKAIVAETHRRRAVRAERETMEEIGKQAHVALMETDEKVRTAEQEIAFAEAEFGSDEVAAFKDALAVAKKILRDAFKVGQLIDDDKPETLAERSQMLVEITTCTKGVDKALDGQMDAIEQLRALETNAKTQTAALIQAQPAREKALDAAQAILTTIKVNGASLLPSVSGNHDYARSMYATADEHLAAAQEAVDKGLLASAALLLRKANACFAKAKTALDNLAKVGAAVAEAEQALPSEIAEAQAEVAKASVAVAAGSRRQRADLSIAQASLESAREEASKASPDFVSAYRYATAANQMADGILDDIREEEERERRAIETAKQQVRAAEVDIAQANAYIESHRSTVSRKARNRLSEAQRRYDEARGSNDLMNSASIAVIASQLANDSYRYAHSDVSAAQSSSGSYGYSGSSSSGSSYGSSSGGGYSSSSSGSSYSPPATSFSSGGSFSGGSSSGGGW